MKRAEITAALPPRLLTAEAAASYLSIPVASFRALGVGRVNLGARIRFDRVALDAWLDENRSPTTRVQATPDEDDADAALARFSQDFRPVSRRA